MSRWGGAPSSVGTPGMCWAWSQHRGTVESTRSRDRCGISAAGHGVAASGPAVVPGERELLEAGELTLLPVVQGSPPGQGGHPRRAHQHRPARRCRNGQDAVWSIFLTVRGCGALGSCQSPHLPCPNLPVLLPSVLASQAVRGCQPPPARKEVSEQEHPHKLPVGILLGCSQAPSPGRRLKRSSPSPLAVLALPESNKEAAMSTG